MFFVLEINTSNLIRAHVTRDIIGATT